MELIKDLIDFIMHLDTHLIEVVNNYGFWTYLILFAIIFCETGLVVTPFLPGDSLIFVVGALSASGELKTFTIYIILLAAAILGDTVNYHIGKYVGPKVFYSNNARFFKKEHLLRTHDFYERHGGKTIIIARFMPIIRTFAPFVAGIGKMGYFKFLFYNAIGAFLWVSICIPGGYFFGNISVVKDNFTLVLLAIIVISLLPAVITYLKERRRP